MSSLQDAIYVAGLGFSIFPVQANSKLPAIAGFPTRASNRQVDVERMWAPDPVLNFPRDYNIGISTSHFGAGYALLVVDIDNKDGRNGFETLSYLAALGYELPDTLAQITPSGGQHLIFWVDQPVRQGTNILGSGVDIRSKGGYIVGATSTVDGKSYKFANNHQVSKAPQWLIDRCGLPNAKDAPNTLGPIETNQEAAEERARAYLQKLDPVGKGGRNDAGYKTACRLKDFGLPAETVSHMLATEWKCEPKLSMSEIMHVTTSAFAYGNKQPGIDTPQAVFDSVEVETKKKSPLEAFGEKYFLVLNGGATNVCWETTDFKGDFKLERMSVTKFHEWMLNETMTFGDGRNHPISQMWIKSQNVRKFQGLVFEPNNKPDPRFYNLWRGFRIKPLPQDVKPSQKAQAALDLFLEHCFKNVCQGDTELGKWLIGYFAHMIQRPQEKPGVALVFKGLKGVGKNALIDRVAYLIGDSAITIADRRHMLGNFNSVLENKFLVTLDEAFWSGDKQSEGMLKAMITAPRKTIERKGSEPYEISSYERVAILGNEDWLAPATADERRFAVFNVGAGRRMDREFFGAMQKGMEQEGGAELLMRHLLDFDLSQVDPCTAPETQALVEQKEASLTPVQEWWHSSLAAGHIVGAPGQESWPAHMPASSFYNAYIEAMRQRNIGSRLLSPRGLAEQLKKLAPQMIPARSIRDGDQVYRAYDFPSLETGRKIWESVFGKGWKWEA